METELMAAGIQEGKEGKTGENCSLVLPKRDGGCRLELGLEQEGLRVGPGVVTAQSFHLLAVEILGFWGWQGGFCRTI